MKKVIHGYYLMLLFSFTLLLTACGSAPPNGDEDFADVLEYIGYAKYTEYTEDSEDIAYTPEELPIPFAENPLFLNILEQVDWQVQVDEMLIAELNSGIYSFDAPLVVADPYGMSPLSALALFISDEPLNISVYVPGRTENTSVSFTFDGYNTRHEIPILGLYPDAQTTVELTGRTQGGEVRRVTFEVQTEPLPPELEKNIILTDLVQPENYQPGFNFTFRPKAAFDAHGEYRWFYNHFGVLQAAMYDYNGHMLFAVGAYHHGHALIFEVNMLGKILSVFYSPYGVCHDIAATDEGNLIVTGSRGDTIEDFIYEIDVTTGEIVNRLDLKRVLQRTRTGGFMAYENYPDNWFHHNAIVYDNGSIIVSGRNQSAVVKLSWPEGELEWILSDHTGWNPMFHNYLFTPVGAGFEWSRGQHTPTILHDFDNNPDTMDILLLDNGNARFLHDGELQRALANNEVIWPERYSRMVHYRINLRTMTIQQIWQFGKELGETYFARWGSSAQMLENGNRLGVFDRHIYYLGEGRGINTNFIEVDSSGNIIWEAYATSTDAMGTFNAYRGERRPLYTAAANDLRIGVPARVLIPENMLP
ncbi:MAG: aryl-sulfate sulfotransferase [Defluviitaleaceae bacterium]|nr:aryl-sulfate sulfotransferase [Defluviitaleaceae bacterium]